MRIFFGDRTYKRRLKLFCVSLDKSSGRKKPGNESHKENYTEFQEEYLSIEGEEPIDEYRKIGDEREIDILHEEREYGSPENVGKSRIEHSLNSERSIDKEILSSDQSDNLDLIPIEEHEIPDAIIDDDEHRKYEKPDDRIDSVLDGQEDIYEPLNTLVLRTIVGQ